MFQEKMYKYLAICVFFNYVNAVTKSSLTFVIDDTGSMSDDIYEVKKGASAIFDTVLSSNVSQIEDFVLVTFNDPGLKHRTTTRDEGEFKRALEKIHVDGGDDCPEMAMAGIARALKESRSGSYLYIFTDASAKDHHNYENVKRLAQAKQSQIVFILTGSCYGTGSEEVYNLLARDTQGQVFHLDHRNEVAKILAFVRQQIKIRPTVLANHDFPPGSHTFDLDVDSTMKELVISVSGTNPSVKVLGPSGETKPTEDIVRTRKVAIVKVKELTPGKYTSVVSSSTKNTVMVTAGTTVHFQHGFSTLHPSSIDETTTKPIPDVKSYLSIKLNTEGTEDDIRLDTVKILDMDSNVIMEQPLEIENEKEKFYIAKNPIEPPNKTFRIAIQGHDTKGNEITRVSLTPIEPQFRAPRTPNKAPVVSIIGDDRVIVEYQQYLELKCFVSGHPKPDVMWESSSKTEHKSVLSLVELPSDYISVLVIDRVISNDTYKCRAINAYGDSSKDIQVQTVKNEYFTILKRPRSATIELDQKARFECEIDANPPVNITWYRNKVSVEENDNVEIINSGATLVIKKMHPSYVGRYNCKVDNINVHRRLWFHVKVSGTEPPVISKLQSQIQVKAGEDVHIQCQILKGKPRPLIYWFFKYKTTGSEKKLYVGEYDDNIYIPEVNTKNSGTYRCEAHNDVGLDYHNTELIVGYPPVITGKDEHVTVNDGQKVNLNCDVSGTPTSVVKWFYNDAALESSKRYLQYSAGLKFKASFTDAGAYYCQAVNDFGSVNKTFYLKVVIPPQMDIPKETTFRMKVGDYLALPCHADGYPLPNLEWNYVSLDAKLPSHKIKASDPSQLILTRIQIAHQGLYTCVASNDGGAERITYKVLVFAPPNIEVPNPKRPFTGVEGDLTLRVPCRTTGVPEPKITWKKGRDGVPSGTEWYDIEDDGTLVVKNLDKKATGTYTCYAENEMGTDAKAFEVIVEAYPAPRTPKTSVIIKEGNSTTLECKVSSKATDKVRWFKDGILLSEEKTYQITDAKLSNAGIYTCRVSDFTKSHSGHIKVIVGSEPKFLYPKIETNIFFEDGSYSEEMDCSATGYPEPHVSWWHDGVLLPVKDMVNSFTMTHKDRGTYVCIVENNFGQITREFSVISQDCVLNVWSEIKDKQPLMISPRDTTWPSFNSDSGYMNIISGEFIRLACPTGFENFIENDIYVFCERELNFTSTTDGEIYKFADFRCKSEVEPILKETDKICWPTNPNAKLVKIGYESLGDFLEVYEVCLDKHKKTSLYAKHSIHHSLADVIPDKKGKHISKLVSSDNSAYDCKQDKYTSSSLGLWFNRKDDCCFSKRQLVDPRDVFPGLPQMATYSNLNTVPHWSTCTSENWEHIEDAVRKLVKSTGAELIVWTGIAQPLPIDKPVSRYLWKVVQDPVTKQSLAIVQINLPDVSEHVAHRNIFCKDICKEITWLNSDTFSDVTKGFTFCCNIIDFENEFKYHGVFDRGTGKVLYDVLGVPDHYSVIG